MATSDSWQTAVPADVALFPSCVVEMGDPGAISSATEVLSALGAEAALPPNRSCCGWPAFSAGRRGPAALLARRWILTHERYGAVVGLSEPCVGMVHLHYQDLLRSHWRRRAAFMSTRTFELSSFVNRFGGPTATGPVGEAAGENPNGSCRAATGPGDASEPRSERQFGAEDAGRPARNAEWWATAQWWAWAVAWVAPGGFALSVTVARMVLRALPRPVLLRLSAARGRREAAEARPPGPFSLVGEAALRLSGADGRLRRRRGEPSRSTAPGVASRPPGAARSR